MPEVFHLSRQLEKAEYDKHQNAIFDEGYRKFLSRLFDPLSQKLLQKHQSQIHQSHKQQPKQGLDFGCGPGPALQALFEEAGFIMNTYDIFYQPDESVLSQTYDFITLTEVIEHLGQPQAVLDKLWGLLKPEGYLGVMTKLVKNRETFINWHYKNDQTHISFFSMTTIEYIAQQFDAKLIVVADDAFIFEKQ